MATREVPLDSQEIDGTHRIDALGRCLSFSFQGAELSCRFQLLVLLVFVDRTPNGHEGRWEGGFCHCFFHQASILKIIAAAATCHGPTTNSGDSLFRRRQSLFALLEG